MLSRRAFLFSALAGPVVCQDPATPPAPVRRRALVIGNQNYPGAYALTNPLHDAADLKAALTQFGFSVDLQADLPLARFEQAADTFAKSLAPGDAALFYYAGHGMQIDQRNLLVPVDFAARDPDSAVKQCFSLHGYERRLEASAAALTVLIVDACRNNPYRQARSWERGLALAEAGLGSYVAFSASPGQVASDNVDERNGLFTKHLLAEMAQPPGLTTLFRRVRERVYVASGETQMPYLHDQMLAEFYLAPPLATAIANDGDASVQELLERGRLAQVAEACSEAFELLDRAVRQDPRNPYAQNAAGVALVCLGRGSQAVERFNMAIRFKPDFAGAYWNRGRTFLREGSYELAIEDFTWAIEEEPRNAAAHSLRGWARLMQREYDEALEDFEAAIELNPADALAFHGRGLVAERRGRYREALEDFEEARARDSRAGIGQDIERVSARLSGR